MAKKRDETTELARALQGWAYEKMKFSPESLNCSRLTLEDFRELCRGRMGALWRHILASYRPLEEVQKIRGNLTLARAARTSHLPVTYAGSKVDTTDANECVSKKAELEKLTGELRQKLKHLENLKEDVNRVQNELSEKAQKVNETKTKVDELRKRRVLLTSYCAKRAQDRSQLAEYDRRLRELIETNPACEKGGQHGDDFGVETRVDASLDVDEGSSGHLAGETARLESLCTRDLRHAAAKLAEIHFSALRDETAKTEANEKREKRARAANQTMTNQLSEDVESAAGRYPAQQLLSSICELTQEGVFRLGEETRSIDIKRDIEELKFQFVSGGNLVDTSLSEDPSQSCVRSVDMLLQERHLEHLQSFLETERLRTERKSAEEKIGRFRLQLDAQLQEKFSRQPELLAMNRSWVDSQLELAGAKAAVEECKVIAAALEKRIERSVAQKEQVRKKYQKIQDFRETVSRKQEQIRVLAKAVSLSRRNIEELQPSVIKYLSTVLCPHQAEINAVLSSLQGMLSREARKFLSLKLAVIGHTLNDQGTKIPLNQISINQLQPGHKFSHKRLLSALDMLKVPLYKSPAAVLFHVMQLKLDAFRRREEVRLLELLNAEKSETLEGLCEQVVRSDAAQLEEIVPVLHRNVTSARETIDRVERLPKQVELWWHQPGLEVLSWKTVEGKTLDQWLKLWNAYKMQAQQQGS